MQALDKKIIQSIFDRLVLIISIFLKKQYFTKEPCRKWRETQIEEEVIVQKKNEEEKNPKKFKAGVGYGSDNTGQNQKWNVSEY